MDPLGLMVSAWAATELYDGSSWTTSPARLSSFRFYMGGCGTQTAGIGFGGYISGGGGNSVATEEFSGPGTTIETVTTS